MNAGRKIALMNLETKLIMLERQIEQRNKFCEMICGTHNTNYKLLTIRY